MNRRAKVAANALDNKARCADLDASRTSTRSIRDVAAADEIPRQNDIMVSTTNEQR
jgi:hypothetical protein